MLLMLMLLMPLMLVLLMPLLLVLLLLGLLQLLLLAGRHAGTCCRRRPRRALGAAARAAPPALPHLP
jgi:hypothetical protein